MNLEKQKENFKNHRATFKDLGNIKILDFKKPNSTEYRIRFLFEEDYRRRCRLLNESNRFSSSSNQTEEQRKIHAEKIQIISSQLPRLIRVDT